MSSAIRRERVEIANTFLRICSEHGRRFFHHKGRISRFELDARGRIWYVDKWSESRIYTHQRDWGRRFSEGGTLLALCKHLQCFIMEKRETLPLNSLGPWPWYREDGGLWGYGDSMKKVRSECADLEKGRAV